MRRLWMGVAGLMMLAACRTEGKNDQAPGTQRRPDRNITAEQQRAEGQAEGHKDLRLARIITMIQAMDQGEIEMSRLAQERAVSADVKAYAAKLASDHRQDLEATGRLTQSRHIDMGAAQDDPFVKAKREATREKLQQLAKLEGRAFDDAYMEGKASEHATLSAIAREGQEISKDNDVDTYLRMVSEQAQDHRARAIAVQSKLCARAQETQAGPGDQAAPTPQTGAPAGRSPQRGASPQGAPPARRGQ
jgi:putative membrane protein